MSTQVNTLFKALFPNAFKNISKKQFKNKETINNTQKYLNFLKHFKITGYVRKVESIEITNQGDFNIAKSKFYTKGQRSQVPCSNGDIFILSDYFTDNHLVFNNRFTVVQCDFSSQNNFKVLYTKEYPINSLSIAQLESILAKFIYDNCHIDIVNSCTYPLEH